MWGIIKRCFGVFSKDMGMDLGTCNTLVYVKGEYRDRWFRDLITGSGRDKRFHKWGQDEAATAALVAALTSSLNSGKRPVSMPRYSSKW